MNYILLDELYGTIDRHEHYRTGGAVETFVEAAECLGVFKVLFVPTGHSLKKEQYSTNTKR